MANGRRGRRGSHGMAATIPVAASRTESTCAASRRGPGAQLDGSRSFADAEPPKPLALSLRLVGEAEALEDHAVEIEVEPDVLALGALAGMEAEPSAAPQQDAVDDAPQHVLHRFLEIGGRDGARRDQHLAHTLPGAVLLAREHLLEGFGLQDAAMNEDLSRLHRRRAGAREHRPPALEVDLGTLAATLELEAPGRLGELEELEHLAREKVLEIAFERGAHRRASERRAARTGGEAGAAVLTSRPSARRRPRVPALPRGRS